MGCKVKEYGQLENAVVRTALTMWDVKVIEANHVRSVNIVLL